MAPTRHISELKYAPTNDTFLSFLEIDKISKNTPMFFRYAISLLIGTPSPNSDFNVKLFTFSKFSRRAFSRSMHWIKKWGTVNTARLQIKSRWRLLNWYPWVTSVCPTLRRLMITSHRRGMLIFVHGMLRKPCMADRHSISTHELKHGINENWFRNWILHPQIRYAHSF